MTHQELIDYWQNQITAYNLEYSNDPKPDLKRLHELDALIEQAKQIMMQLLLMDTEEPIIGSLSTLNSLESVSSIGLDPEYTTIVSDNFWQLLTDNPPEQCKPNPCTSPDPDDRCENCNCWKSTRSNCS